MWLTFLLYKLFCIEYSVPKAKYISNCLLRTGYWKWNQVFTR